MNSFINNTPLELAKGALKACQAVDDLENSGASEQEIVEAEETVNQLSQLISQFYQAQFNITAANDNNKRRDDDAV